MALDKDVFLPALAVRKVQQIGKILKSNGIRNIALHSRIFINKSIYETWKGLEGSLV